MPEPVLVAGAGIGGLTVSLALAARGYPVSVFERREALEEVGAGIQISPNASRVLQQLGLADRLTALAVQPERLVIRRIDDAGTIGGVSLGTLAERFGAPYFCLRRADLQTILAEAVARTPGISLHLGTSVTGFTEEDGRVTVETEAADGGGRIAAPLLLGADGLWSTVAQRLRRRSGQPRFTGFEAWRSLVSIEAVPASLRRRDVSLWLGDGWHVVHYPVAAGRLMNVVLVRGGRAAVTGWSSPGDPADIRAMIAKASMPLRALLEPVADWQVWSLFDAAARPMASGRVALLGDAAHPVLPFLAQGAALAIEDAGVLVQLLGPASLFEATRVPAALAVLDRLRRPRAARVQQAARGNGRIYHLGWPASLARDAAMRVIGVEGLERRYDWLYGWRHQRD